MSHSSLFITAPTKQLLADSSIAASPKRLKRGVRAQPYSAMIPTVRHRQAASNRCGMIPLPSSSSSTPPPPATAALSTAMDCVRCQHNLDSSSASLFLLASSRPSNSTTTTTPVSINTSSCSYNFASSSSSPSFLSSSFTSPSPASCRSFKSLTTRPYISQLMSMLVLVIAFNCIVTLSFQNVLLYADAKPSRPLLRGVTIRNWPYADRLNDRYEGFAVDLVNQIAELANFDYRLYFSPDGKYGTELNGHINGMLGEVYRNRADFAIADLTITDSRKRYVDFTEPFLENELAAIIRRDDAAGLRTLEDLVTLNEINSKSDEASQEAKGIIDFGTYRTGSTYFYLSKSRDPVARRMYTWMVRHPEALVTSAKEGFDRVNAGRYAFIVESTFAEYLTGIYCNLTTLYDTRSLYPRKFAIALPKGSPYLQPFNQAIRELKASGVIDRYRAQYWSNRCNDPNYNSHEERTINISEQEKNKVRNPPPVVVQSKPQLQPAVDIEWASGHGHAVNPTLPNVRSGNGVHGNVNQNPHHHGIKPITSTSNTHYHRNNAIDTSENAAFSGGFSVHHSQHGFINFVSLFLTLLISSFLFIFNYQ